MVSLATFLFVLYWICIAFWLYSIIRYRADIGAIVQFLAVLVLGIFVIPLHLPH